MQSSHLHVLMLIIVLQSSVGNCEEQETFTERETETATITFSEENEGKGVEAKDNLIIIDDAKVASSTEISSKKGEKLPGNRTEPILPEWGGNCTRRHWEKCSHLEMWNTSYYLDRKKPELGFGYHVTNCTALPALCLRNGWTVTRCQLLCMRCNREILSKYNKYVAKEGNC